MRMLLALLVASAFALSLDTRAEAQDADVQKLNEACNAKGKYWVYDLVSKKCIKSDPRMTGRRWPLSSSVHDNRRMLGTNTRPVK